jgi:small conductance mechanosensitive channel
LSEVVHIIQNSKINVMSNMTKDWSTIVFDIGVAYKEDPQVVMDFMQKSK